MILRLVTLGVIVMVSIIIMRAPSKPVPQPAMSSTSMVVPAYDEKQDVSSLPDLNINSVAFELRAGIKDIFDSLIQATESTEKTVLSAAAGRYCLQQKLSSSGCESFLALFSRYIDYKIALAKVQEDTVDYANSIIEIEARLEAINQLQYTYFNQLERDVLFRADLAIEKEALSRYKIAADATLSRQQKRDLLANHFEQLPESQHRAFAPSLAINELDNIENMSGSVKYKLDVARARFGDESAERLASVWQRRAHFDLTLKSIKNEYQRVAEAQQLPWLMQYFSKPQARRARAILNTDHNND